MKYFIVLSFSVVVLLISSGCTSTGTKSAVPVAQAPAIPIDSYLSVRTGIKPNPQDCPVNNLWKKESLERLSKYANACAISNNSERLQTIGDWLAQRYPDLPWGAYYLSIAAQLSKSFSRALWMVDLAIKKSPNTPMLHYQKGRIYWDLGEYTNSVQAFKEALKLNKDFSDAHQFLAQLYFKDQNFKQAEVHFNHVVKLEPSNSVAHAGLAEAQFLQGLIERSVANYNLAVHLNPRNIDYRIRLADLYENSVKNYSQALTTYQRLQTTMIQSGISAKDISVDVSAKIKKLEEIVLKRDVAEKKPTVAPKNKEKKVKQ